MSGLWFIRARLRRDAAGSDGALIRLLADSDLDPAREHHLVWTLFGDDPDRARDFVFRLDRRDGRPEVMAYAPREPEGGRIWEVQAKPFAPDLRAGDRLRFSVRVNPVVQRKNVRFDAVYDALLKAGGSKAADRDAVAAERGAAWFRERAPGLGLDLGPDDPLRATDYRSRVLRKPTAAERPVRLSTMEIAGEGRVRDPEALLRALAGGVGKGRAYGCGMLLIARA